MRSHVKVLAVLFIVLGGLFVLSAFVLAVIFSILAASTGALTEPDARFGFALLGVTGGALAVLLVLLSLPMILCGTGLLKHRRWARVLGIVLAALAVIQFPYGTIFGVYALWVLFSKDSEQLFDGSIASPPGR